MEIKLKGRDELRAPMTARKGPIGERWYVREHRLEHGERHRGEKHATDHLTRVHGGKLLMNWRDDNGGSGEELIEGPCYVDVLAERWHTFLAIDGPASFDCIFAKPSDKSLHEPYHSQIPADVLERR
jgi:hypothetical protein